MATFHGVATGKKTYLVAVGLAVLGVVQLSTGDVPLGMQSLLAAMAAAGLRGAITKARI